jgi:single-strand DNA-binding protein
MGKIVTLSVATSESWNDKQSGERKERVEWHRVVIFNENLGTVAEKYLTKGRKVYLEGQLETRKYTDNSGAEKYTTEVVLRQYRGELQILDSNRQEDDRGGGRDRDDRGGGRERGRDDRGRDDRGGREDRGRDDRRAASGTNGSGRGDDRNAGRASDERRAERGGPTWSRPTQTDGDLDDEIPF